MKYFSLFLAILLSLNHSITVAHSYPDDLHTLDSLELCPGGIVATELECGLWSFAIEPGEAVIAGFWTFGDGQIAESSGNTVTYEFLESGEYTVEVNSSLSQPCFNNYFTTTVDVEVCESSCELDMEVNQDGDILYLTPYNYPDNATIFWSVNGEGGEPGEEFTFDLSEPGTYQICAAYETPECPEGVFWCETWTVEGEGECPDEDDFYADNVEGSCTSWVFEIGSFVEGELVIWDYGDGTDEIGGHFTDHTYQEEGEYQVCAYYSSPLCPDTVILCETILVECGENPCELDMEFEQDGDTLLFYPYNYPDNATIGWQVNNEWMGTGDMFSISIADPGSYQVCASYETPECPEGVVWCETWTIEENECPFELSVQETEECGCYELSLNGQWGSQYIWNLGDTSFTSSSNAVTHCYDPGNYTGYVQILGSNYPECEQEPVVFFIEVPDCENPECTWFEFEISTNIDLLPIELEWEMSSQNGSVAGAGSVSLSGDTTTFSGEACLLAGCYSLTLSSDFPIGLGSFEFDFPTIPGLPLEIDWIQDQNPNTLDAQFGLAVDCNWAVGVDESGLETAVVYPVPASDILNIRLTNESQTNLKIYNSNGRMVKELSIQQSGPIDVSGLPAGLYLLQLQQDNNFKTFSIPLLN